MTEHSTDEPVFDGDFWDARYRESTSVWSGNPNPILVSETSALPPGTALDIGSGEGADAIWLAARGWTTTAVDISTVALQRAAERASAADPDTAARITWSQHDLIEWAPPAGAFDLITAQFMHLPSAQRLILFARLAEAVAPGGTLLIVGHHPSDMQSTVQRPQRPDLFFTAEEVAASLDPAQWEIGVSDARARTVADAEGAPAVVRDSVLRAQRRPVAE
ncbi:class I SAM-dependent methyltransferase [Cryobacterium psychrophilum]|uniref:Class I SAM-dependent methyltransferase n=1 Tax=Cryobacterium psychrophilum TaxID=41988 RepID=A0A4Y8KXP8_9MICO|nr:class I SAM-dependent methyltransferase [Cryobacterium psychrophilum]TFD81786.1 class I SAM-dependent methyltransferase [Cryobacterium psychrophilum]